MVWRLPRHENICPFYGVCFDVFPSGLTIVTPWMDNGDLQSYLEDHPQVNKQEMVRLSYARVPRPSLTL